MSYVEDKANDVGDWVGDEVVRAPGDYIEDRISDKAKDYGSKFEKLSEALTPASELEKEQRAAGYITDKQVENALKDKENGVSELMGILSRAEWNDFTSRYLPRIKEQADRITSGENITDAVNEARSSTGLAFDTAEKNMKLNNERLGLNLSARQKQQQQSSMGLSEVAAQVNNVNDARVSAIDRDNALLSSGFASSMKTDTES